MTTRQIDHARAQLLVRSSLLRWRKALGRHHDIYQLAGSRADRYALSSSLKIWLNTHRCRSLLWKGIIFEEERRRTSKTWMEWRARFEARRIERWERWMRDRESDIEAAIAMRIMMDAFLVSRFARNSQIPF